MPQQIELVKIEFVQSRAEINTEAVDDYAYAMRMGTNFPAIRVVFDSETYWCYDGCHRTLAARQAKKTTILASVHEGTRRDAVLRSCGVNATNGMRRTNEDKIKAVQTLLNDPEWSEWDISKIAEHAKVSRRFVRKRIAIFTTQDIQTGAGHFGHIVSLSPPQEQETKLSVHFSSETPEHYTPQVVIDATLACLGEIDLDPCSNSSEQPNVPATTHFTREDDGLLQAWYGRVYMNPPYGREIDKWVKKLYEEHNSGRTTEAIALVPSRTDTQWWLHLRDFPVCFVTGRLTFVGNDDPAPFPSAIFYLGENIGIFYRAFHELGDCWQRMMPGISFGE